MIEGITMIIIIIDILMVLHYSCNALIVIIHVPNLLL